jgi:DNA-directed RNA polymerase subunit RPC12/RpoP
MCAQPKTIVIKKPSLLVKKKERPSPSAAPPVAPPLQTTIPGQPPSDTYCNQCGGRRILQGSPQFFDFHCTYCGQVNQSRGYVSGTEIQCIACGNAILIPPPPSRPVPAHLGGSAMTSQRLKFFCVFCGQKLSATLNMVGQPTVCPSCNRGLTIPQPPTTG